MTDRKPHPPPRVILPKSPSEFRQDYFNNLIKLLQLNIDSDDNPSLLRGGELFLNDLPTRGAGLRAGYVFSDSGTLKIVRDQDAFADSFNLTVSLGTVTVST